MIGTNKSNVTAPKKKKTSWNRTSETTEVIDDVI